MDQNPPPQELPTARLFFLVLRLTGLWSTQMGGVLVGSITQTDLAPHLGFRLSVGVMVPCCRSDSDGERWEAC